MKHHFGWKRQRPDFRDHKFTVEEPNKALPSSVDLRPQMPPVYDQGQLGSCTANGIAGAIEHQLIVQGQPPVTPSRLFIYFNERAIEGTIDQDSGANIRDGAKSVSKQGVCAESEWPYDISQFTTKPSASCYTDALNEVALEYQAVDQTQVAIQTALAAGLGVAFGFTVYESFESPEVASTGIVPMPKKSESILGGHCTLISGYNIPGYSTDLVLVRNSWGDGWALNGYFLMPWEYILNPNLSSDFWVFPKIGATASKKHRLPPKK